MYSLFCIGVIGIISVVSWTSRKIHLHAVCKNYHFCMLDARILTFALIILFRVCIHPCTHRHIHTYTHASARTHTITCAHTQSEISDLAGFYKNKYDMWNISKFIFITVFKSSSLDSFPISDYSASLRTLLLFTRSVSRK